MGAHSPTRRTLRGSRGRRGGCVHPGSGGTLALPPALVYRTAATREANPGCARSGSVSRTENSELGGRPQPDKAHLAGITRPPRRLRTSWLGGPSPSLPLSFIEPRPTREANPGCARSGSVSRTENSELGGRPQPDKAHLAGITRPPRRARTSWLGGDPRPPLADARQPALEDARSGPRGSRFHAWHAAIVDLAERLEVFPVRHASGCLEGNTGEGAVAHERQPE